MCPILECFIYIFLTQPFKAVVRFAFIFTSRKSRKGEKEVNGTCLYIPPRALTKVRTSTERRPASEIAIEFALLSF